MAAPGEHVVLDVDASVGELAGELVAGRAHAVVLRLEDDGAGEGVELMSSGDGESVVEHSA